MRKFLPGWFTVLFALGLLAGAGYRISGPVEAEEPTARMAATELFMDVYSMTRAGYVDTVESRELIEAAIEGMLQSLDPNSMLLTPDQYDDLRVQLESSFEGIGITIGERDGWPTVISPLEGTPAHRQGVRSGDRIVMVDTLSTEDMTVDEAVSHIRGPRGTTVVLTILRPGVVDTLLISIERDVIDYPSVSSSFMLSDSTGYLRLSRFSQESAGEVLDAVRGLQAEGAVNLVLDLRGNSGGLFAPAVDVADIFLPAGSPVVTTRGQAVGETSYSAKLGQLFEGDMAVLIDGGSASSAEIVAGALQDDRRAVIVGTRSFGKGSVQSLSDLGSYPGLGNYALKLTTARYYTPSGRCIDRTLRDDFMEQGAEEDWGIVPDIEVETPEVSAELVLRLEEEAQFFRFATQYTLNNDVPEGFWPGEEVLSEFKAFLDSEGFEWSEDGFEASLGYIERALLREIALRVWDMDTYYRETAPRDEYILTALEVLERGGSR